MSYTISEPIPVPYAHLLGELLGAIFDSVETPHRNPCGLRPVVPDPDDCSGSPTPSLSGSTLTSAFEPVICRRRSYSTPLSPLSPHCCGKGRLRCNRMGGLRLRLLPAVRCSMTSQRYLIANRLPDPSNTNVTFGHAPMPEFQSSFRCSRPAFGP